jgi:hypothetical protein
MKANDEAPRLKRTSVAFVLMFTVITGGIYLPIWFLAKREWLNQLHSKEKLGKGIHILGIICFSIIALLSFYSDLAQGITLAEGGMDLGTPFNYLDLSTSIFSLIVIVPFIQQTLKVKKMLAEHYNDYLQKNIKFSNILTLLFLNIYLQYKINRLEQ